MAKLNFQQPLLKTSVSRDPSEMILICRFLLKLKTIFFVENVIYIFWGFFDDYKVVVFCNNVKE